MSLEMLTLVYYDAMKNIHKTLRMHSRNAIDVFCQEKKMKLLLDHRLMVIFVQITVFGKIPFERCAGNDFKKVADCFVRNIISNVHKFVTQVVFMGVSDVMLAKQ